MGTEALLQVTNLKKHYPVGRGVLSSSKSQVKALDGLSFSIGQGETLAVVGESGCGKSTMARVILALETPTDGEVSLQGKNVHTLKGEDYRWFRRQIQLVFQDPWSSLNPRMRVRELVSEPLVINSKLSRSELNDRVDEVLLDVGLDPRHGDRYPHEFSGGQRQRISVASGLICSPKLLVLDEPVSALDVSIRAQIMNMFRDIQEKYNISYLLIAHDLGTTRYLADHVAVMYLGKIVEQGPTEELFEQPLHPYTKSLFSAALPSHPDEERTRIVLEGEVPSPIDPPPGCAFHPRCPMKIGDVCEGAVPRLRAHASDTGAGAMDDAMTDAAADAMTDAAADAKLHLVSCHLYHQPEFGETSAM